MERPRSPYREVVDEENIEILHQLHPKGWSAFQEAWEEANFFGIEPAKVGLLRSLRMTSAIDGKHRDSLVESIKGQRSPTLALGVQEANGHLNGGKPESKVPHL